MRIPVAFRKGRRWVRPRPYGSREFPQAIENAAEKSADPDAAPALRSDVRRSIDFPSALPADADPSPADSGATPILPIQIPATRQAGAIHH